MQLAKQQLETALRSVQRESMMITDSEVADVHYKLGRICWTMGGVQLTDPTQARAHLIAATKEESEVQVRPWASSIVTNNYNNNVCQPRPGACEASLSLPGRLFKATC